MSSRIALYKRAAGLRLRPVPEMEFCLAYTPRRPNIYTLNPASWLIVELCDGRPWAAVETAYVEAFAAHLPPEAARRQLHAGRSELVSKKILVRAGGSAAGDPAPSLGRTMP